MQRTVSRFRATLLSGTAAVLCSLALPCYGSPPQVHSLEEINSTSGGFGGMLEPLDEFGRSVARIGDLDGNGTCDLAVGAIKDDDGGVPPDADRGAVWILFLDSALLDSGAVVINEQKITDSTEVPLADGDFFGTSVAWLGDLDGGGPSATAIAVGMHQDMGDDKGAVWILFLDSAGLVMSGQKIDSSDPLLSLLANARFGSAIACLGDLDGPGGNATTIAVGAFRAEAGEVWILGLDTSGTVQSAHRINGSSVAIGQGDAFGHSIAPMGDFDGPAGASVTAIAVGAFQDDDGVVAPDPNVGAVWILLLDATGAVLSTHKISADSGNFLGTLEAGDSFGFSVACLGDLDGNGVGDLAVGAPGDDDGGPSRGAVWILLLDELGMVSSHHKLSHTSGASTPTLSDSDVFGNSLASLGDLDGDGITDMAVGAANNAAGIVPGTLWLAFLSIQNPIRCDVLLADLTGDGILDAVTADSGVDSVKLLVGDGSGGFDAGIATALTAADLPVAVTTGNLVAGGGTDIAAAAKDADAVRILSNDPEGTLAVSSSVDVSALGANPVGVAAGDVDGSGMDDLAVALEGEILIAGLGGVALSLDGGVPALLVAPAGGFGAVRGVEIVDLDGDGDLDVIASTGGTLFVPGVKSLLLYENTGSFSAPVVLTTAEEPRSFCCGDIDGDGDADLVVTTQDLLTPGALQLFLNDSLTAGSWSAGSFSSGGTYAGGDSPFDIACDDLDDENIEGFFYRNDAVTVNLGSGDLTRYDGFVDGVSGFEATTTLLGGPVPAALAIGDLNGDKTPDVVVANKTSSELTVILADPLAQSQAFGTGCAGTGGLVPAIASTNLPSAGATDFSLELSNALGFTPAVLGFSLTLTPVSIGACNLYVEGLAVAGPFLTDGAGTFSLPVPLPTAASPLFGCDVFYQWVVVDPNGALGGVLAVSDGLRTKFAN